MGIKISQALQEKGQNFAVVDANSRTVGKLRKKDIPAFFGDIADVEFLDSLHLRKAKLLILTTPDPHDQKTLISFAKRENPKITIISNLHHYKHAEDLYNIGADYVIMPHLLGGQLMEEVIKNGTWKKSNLKKLRAEQLAEIETDF